jgi:chromosome partitioning protein
MKQYRFALASPEEQRRMIIVLAHTKGGVGKSTLAVNLAVERSRTGRDVLLVDADEQATASDFTALRAEQLGTPGYTAVALSGPAVRTQVLQLRPKYQDIIIDAGGRDTAGLRAALTVADVAIVPFQPRSFDLWTLEQITALIAEAQGYRDRPLKAVAILNFADPQGTDNAAAAEALSGNQALTYLDAPIGRRKAFPNAASLGRGVGELKPQDPKASAEIAALVRAAFESEAISE